MTGVHATGDGNEAWAPDSVFATILQYTVIATFDLILELPQGVLLVQRRLSPYRGLWALPGLRMFRGETLEASLRRIAWAETGVRIKPRERVFINQAVRRFRSPIRQDLSTCYAFRLNDEVIQINEGHFSGNMYIKTEADIPTGIGGVYRDHLKYYFARGTTASDY